MALKDDSLRERVVKLETEVKLMADIARKLPEEFARVRGEFSARFDRLEQKLDQKIDKLMGWVLGVMFALLIAVVFKR